MNTATHNLLLADDDADDCLFFREALEELPVSSSLKTVYDGEELMNWLSTCHNNLPDALFLDLNMDTDLFTTLKNFIYEKVLAHLLVIKSMVLLYLVYFYSIF